MVIWVFSFKVKDGDLLFSPKLTIVFMLLGKVGFVLFSIGFFLQLIHQCCLLS
jgi:hypothetical protein